MTVVSALTGGAMGFAAQCLSNGIRKIPTSRQPWKHVGLFMAGCWVGQKYPQWEEAALHDVNEMRASRGLPPMVGSNAWIKYEAPETR